MTQYFFLPQYFESNKQILNRYIKRCLKNNVYKNPAPGVRGGEGSHMEYCYLLFI